MVNSDTQRVQAIGRYPTQRRELQLLGLAFAFVVIGCVTLSSFDAQRSVRLDHFFAGTDWAVVLASFAVTFLVAHLVLNRGIPRRDPLILPTVAMLTAMGLLLVWRLAINFLFRQILWMILSVGGMLVIACFGGDLQWLKRFRYTWLFGGLGILAATLVFGVNPSGYGPRLWLGIGPVFFQPAELVKLLLTIYLASYLADRRELIIASHERGNGGWSVLTLAYIGPLLAMFALAALLVAWQQDLGAALLFFLTSLTMLYLGTGRWQYVPIGLALFSLASAAGFIGSAKVAARVETWLNPWPEAAGRAFQTVQSLQAVGGGGILGQGLGLGLPNFIPAVHTDFVYAALAEELGLAGVLVTIILYVIVLMRAFGAAARCRHLFEALLTAGVGCGLAIQAWVIMAGNAKIIPITGVTLPFVSYGGSSLLMSYLAVGLLLRASCWPTGSTGLGRGVATRAAYAGHRLPLVAAARTLCWGFAVLAVCTAYWSVIMSDALSARIDNPRRILSEQRIVRGEIRDRTGRTLAASSVGTTGIVTRTYPAPDASHVVGYSSLRYGTTGIEAARDQALRGNIESGPVATALRAMLHRAPIGLDVQLTLDADLQTSAQGALAGATGAAVLLETRSGAVLAMASSPGYDPNQLEEAWDTLVKDPAAPLLNRATHGKYQPGSALQTIILAEALSQETAHLDDVVPDATTRVEIDGTLLGCASPVPETATLEDAYRASCPKAFGDLGVQLGSQGIDAAFERWALDRPPPIEIGAEAADWLHGTTEGTAALRAEALGQGKLVVSPLQMALVAATVAGRGEMPVPYLVENSTSPGNTGTGTVVPHQPESRAIINPEVAGLILSAWDTQAGILVGSQGLAVSGADGRLLGWYLGAAPAATRREYAIAVLVEGVQDTDTATSIATEIVQVAVGQAQ
jgi:cell division protein FtsW (lipid II flippase)